MINEGINTVAKLKKSLMLAVNVVSTYPKHTPYETFSPRYWSRFLYLLRKTGTRM